MNKEKALELYVSLVGWMFFICIGVILALLLTACGSYDRYVVATGSTDRTTRENVRTLLLQDWKIEKTTDAEIVTKWKVWEIESRQYHYEVYMRILIRKGTAKGQCLQWTVKDPVARPEGEGPTWYARPCTLHRPLDFIRLTLRSL